MWKEKDMTVMPSVITCPSTTGEMSLLEVCGASVARCPSIEKWDYKAVIIQVPTSVPTLGDTWHTCQHICMWYLLKPIKCGFEIVCCTLAEPTGNPAGWYQCLKTLKRKEKKEGGKKENTGKKTSVKCLVFCYSIAKGQNQ